MYEIDKPRSDEIFKGIIEVKKNLTESCKKQNVERSKTILNDFEEKKILK